MTKLRKQTLLMNALCATMEVADKLKLPQLYDTLHIPRPEDAGYNVSGETDILTLSGNNPETGQYILVQSYIYSDGETRSIVLVDGTTFEIKHERVSILI